ncbi:MAG: hypothetical protein FJY07_02395 [Bacteroidetes bacterium]|nr:hypothetical protein [Bacteroidota bacterium]
MRLPIVQYEHTVLSVCAYCEPEFKSLIIMLKIRDLQKPILSLFSKDDDLLLPTRSDPGLKLIFRYLIMDWVNLASV